MCDRRDIIERNIRSVKLSSPDVRPLLPSGAALVLTVNLQYKGWEADRAVEDYWKRIKLQEDEYEEVTADEGPFIKIMNVGEKISVNRIEGGSRSVAAFWAALNCRA